MPTSTVPTPTRRQPRSKAAPARRAGKACPDTVMLQTAPSNAPSTSAAATYALPPSPEQLMQLQQDYLTQLATLWTDRGVGQAQPLLDLLHRDRGAGVPEPAHGLVGGGEVEDELGLAAGDGAGDLPGLGVGDLAGRGRHRWLRPWPRRRPHARRRQFRGRLGLARRSRREIRALPSDAQNDPAHTQSRATRASSRKRCARRVSRKPDWTRPRWSPR